MLHRLIIVNFITECLKMTKKWSILKCCFLAVNGLNWGILAKNRITRIFFTLFFEKKRKFVSLFVLQIFTFKLVSHQFLVVSTIIRYQCPLLIYDFDIFDIFDISLSSYIFHLPGCRLFIDIWLSSYIFHLPFRRFFFISYSSSSSSCNAKL